ncbi:AAA family ATPase [Nonomuraea sp. NBC_01738]|uniref:AfsR/SARP family transcriptional regulator n=1 Tax=Nonomuraea sp. NBC_01738 TaxID=2976003 RepID=UPI002E0D2C3B|nr:AAA family ATPase [Nonomuraea sp. NBC_01738]
MDDDVLIHLLGPVTASSGSGDLLLGPPRQRAVLTMLASRPGRVVPMGRLIAGLWAGDPPRTAEQSVYTYVSGLRRALEPGRARRAQAALLSAAAGGYSLRVRPDQVDASLFAGRVEQARRLQESGQHREALQAAEAALALWRGTALSGVPGPFADTERARLDELRLTALERRAGSLLRLARPEEALSFLDDLTRRHPLRERLRELLMLALLGCGRHAEALEVFEQGRRVLREELGADPGPRLVRCYELVLRGGIEHGSPPDAGDGDGRLPRGDRTAVVPRQLPRDLLGFVGRETEIAELVAPLAPAGDAPPGPLVVITGPPGVGKSALAVRVAHRVAARFPDGQLHVNLRGATPEVAALTPLDVLGRFLRALGVPPASVPADLDEAAALWRSSLYGRRTLVLLDDAAGLDQIAPLVSAPLGTAFLVTSRETMAAGDDCVQLHLGRMPDAEAATMLARLAGVERVAADPAQTARLVRLCDGLPLALRVAGARLADRPEWDVAVMTARLGDERTRLGELELGSVAVRASLAASWAALRDGARPVDRAAGRLLALSGRLHVHDLTPGSAARLLDVPVAAARLALERLVDAHLLERLASGRYHPHDLVRLFAGELEPERAEQALERVTAFYAATTSLAEVLLDPHRVQPAWPAVPAEPAALRTAAGARAWLEAEEHNLVAAASQAMEAPGEALNRLGVAVAFALLWFQHNESRGADLVMLNEKALKVCVRLGEEAGAQQAHGHIAAGLRVLGRDEEATRRLEAQLAMARRLGDRFSEMRALGNLGSTHLNANRHGEALEYAHQQFEVAEGIGTALGMRYARLISGMASQALGRPAEARTALEAALASARAAGDVMHEGQALMGLGEVLLAEGRYAEALGCFGPGAELQREGGFKIGELRCLIRMSSACRSLGRPADALTHVALALPLARGVGNERWLRQAEEERELVRRALGG